MRIAPTTRLRTSLAAVGLFLPMAAVARADDWPQWGGPTHDGVWAETGIVESFPSEGLPIRWRAAIAMGFSSPVVAGGRVYVTDAELLDPRVRETVHCFDARTGQRLWRYSSDTDHPDWIFMAGQQRGPGATPVVRDGRLYVLGMFGQLTCLDAGEGGVLWTHNLLRTYQLRDFPTDGSPWLEGDLLIVAIGGKPGAGVVAFEKQSGREAWRALDELSTHSSPFVVSAGAARQLIVWTQQSIVSLCPDDGRTYWREPMPTSADYAVATPVFHRDRLLISGLMFQLDPDRPAASVLWPSSRAVARRILSNTSTPLFRGDHVYSARLSGSLACLDARTGETVWETRGVTDERTGSSIHLTVQGDSVLLLTNRGELIRAHVAPEGYREISRAPLIEPTWPFGGRNVAWASPATRSAPVLPPCGVSFRLIIPGWTPAAR